MKSIRYFFTSYYNTIDIGWWAHPPVLERSQLPTQRSLLKCAIHQTINFTSALTPQQSRFSLSLLQLMKCLKSLRFRGLVQCKGPPVVVQQEAHNNSTAFPGGGERDPSFLWCPESTENCIFVRRNSKPTSDVMMCIVDFHVIAHNSASRRSYGSDTYVHIAVEMENLMES
jgi:hypothetical protein